MPLHSTQAVQDLCERAFLWVTRGMHHKNVELRSRQFAVAADASQSLLIAKRLVSVKIRNCRTMNRRNASDRPSHALERAEGARRLVRRRHEPRVAVGNRWHCGSRLLRSIRCAVEGREGRGIRHGTLVRRLRSTTASRSGERAVNTGPWEAHCAMSAMQASLR